MTYRWPTSRLDWLKNQVRDGVAVVNLTAGETLAAGDLCYLDSSGEMTKADADAESSAKSLLGISVASLTSGKVGEFLIKGFYTTSGLTSGEVLYLSPTAGAWAGSHPTDSGQISRVIGYAVTATQLFFDPDKTWLTIR